MNDCYLIFIYYIRYVLIWYEAIKNW